MIVQIQVQKIKQLTGHNAAVYALDRGPEAHHFLSGAGEGWVAQWDLRDPELGQLVAKVDRNIFSLCYLKENNQLVIGNMDGGVHWVNIDHPEKNKNIAHHEKGVYAIERIGEWVYSLGGAGRISRWSAAEQRSLESLHLSNQSLRCVAYSAARNELAIGASDHAIYRLDATTLDIKERVNKAHDNSVFTLQYSPNGQHLISGGRDAHLKVWALEPVLTPISSQPAHWFTINHVAIHPKVPIFATASRDKTIKIWDLDTFALLKVIDAEKFGGHRHSVNRLLWSADNNFLVSASDDRSIIIWQIECSVEKTL